MVEGYLQRAAGKEGPTEQLTARQREILLLLAEGKNTKEIANVLGISIKTVEADRLQLMDRLIVSTSTMSRGSSAMQSAAY